MYQATNTRNTKETSHNNNTTNSLLSDENSDVPTLSTLPLSTNINNSLINSMEDVDTESKDPLLGGNRLTVQVLDNYREKLTQQSV